jgi:hypothetical protein
MEYRWNFGDSAAGNWARGSVGTNKNKNQATGPEAAHVFETAGTYTVQLTGVAGSDTKTANVATITVQDPNVVFAGTKTLCFSGIGNFSECPVGATRVTTTNAVSAINGNIGTGGKRLLFRRGETFQVPSSITVAQPGPGIIGAYGSGEKPVLRATSNSPMFSLSSPQTPTGVSDWRFQDLAINGNMMATSGFNGAGSFSRVLLNRVDISDIGFGLLLSVSNLNVLNGAVPYLHGLWDEVYVVDSTVTNMIPGDGFNGMLLSARRFAALGNGINPKLGGEHGIRTHLCDRCVISSNTIEGIRAGKVGVTIRGAVFGGDATQRPGQYSEKIVVSDNRFNSAMSGALLSAGPQNQNYDERGRNMIFERNYFYAASTGALVTINQPDITVRNNLFYWGGQDGGAPITVKDEGYTSGITPPPTRVNVYNNTVYSASTGSWYWTFFQLMGNGANYAGTTFDVKNNLVYAPRIGSNNQIVGTYNQTGAVVTQSNNTTSVYTNPLLSAVSPLVPVDFKPQVGSYATGRGISVPVYSDYFGKDRTGSMDIGAILN